MKIIQKRVNGKFGFESTNESGAVLRTDGSEKIGGENFGFRPMELIAAGVGSCASIDILLILEKQKQVVEDYEVIIEATRTDTIPAIFDSIHVSISLFGEVALEKAEKAAALSFEKYCSVSRIVEKTAKITHSVVVNPSKNDL